MTEEELSDSTETQPKRWHLLTNKPGQESEEEENSAMAALMRSTDKKNRDKDKL